MDGLRQTSKIFQKDCFWQVQESVKFSVESKLVGVTGWSVSHGMPRSRTVGLRAITNSYRDCELMLQFPNDAL